MKATKQTNQRKGGSVIQPGRGKSNKWTSYLKALRRKHLGSVKTRPTGKGARGRRQRL